jgi:hypothetical protein
MGRSVLPSTARATGLACLLLVVVAGCAPGVRQPPAAPGGSVTVPQTSRSSSPAPASWTERCTSQVSYWAGEKLSGRDGGYDYQEMGLSGTTNEALQAVLTSPDRKNRPVWIHAAATRECRARAATAAQHEASPGSGWPQ